MLPVDLITQVMKNTRKRHVHYLKTVEPYFSAVKSGEKTFEVRRFDRDFQVGDLLRLVEYNPQRKSYGEHIIKKITYMLTDKPYVPEGYVILGISDYQEEFPFQ